MYHLFCFCIQNDPMIISTQSLWKSAKICSINRRLNFWRVLRLLFEYCVHSLTFEYTPKSSQIRRAYKELFITCLGQNWKFYIFKKSVFHFFNPNIVQPFKYKKWLQLKAMINSVGSSRCLHLYSTWFTLVRIVIINRFSVVYTWIEDRMFHNLSAWWLSIYLKSNGNGRILK